MLSRCYRPDHCNTRLTAAATGGAAAQNTVKIGMVMPMTGTLASAGKQVVAGARLYIKQHGDTVAGKRIELIVKDDASSVENGKRLIQEPIVNDKVDVIGGGLTADLLASAPLITEAKKPTVIMLSSTSAVIDKSPYFVRTSCTLAQSSAIMADWAIQERHQEGRYPGDGFFAGTGGGGDLQGPLRRPAARSRKRSASRCRTRTSRRSCSAYGMRRRRPCSCSSPRSRPPPSPSSSWSAASTRPGSS